MSTFYGGISSDGTGHVLVIDDKDWTWPKSTYLNKQFGGLPIGTSFDLEYELNDNTITVDWTTLKFHDLVYDNIDSKYVLNNATGKKMRTVKATKNKLDKENLRNMTLGDIEERLWRMSMAQKQALIAVIIAEILH
tara:strand:- start:1897 stop:2304 length:408 start_codon:yes stop_codon:yes gene_type:complete